MVLAIEPMVTAGRHGVRVGEDHWAIYSQDGSLAAHFEFTVAVTADGPRILTPWHEAGDAQSLARSASLATLALIVRASFPLLTSIGALAARSFALRGRTSAR